METKFDMDNFEHSLKQHADQFSMIPSKRVWNGVYNSLHPGSKWPSLTMLLFFLLTLVGIGPLNHLSKNYTVTTLPDNSQNSINEESDLKVFSMNSYLNAQKDPSEEISFDKVIALNIDSDQNSSIVSKSIESSLSNATDAILQDKTFSDNKDLQKSSLPSSKNIVQSGESQLANLPNGIIVQSDISQLITPPGNVVVQSSESNLATPPGNVVVPSGESKLAPPPGGVIVQSDKSQLATPPGGVIVNLLDYKKDVTSAIPAIGISMDKISGNQHSILLSDNMVIDDSHNLISFLKSNPGKSILIQLEDGDNVDAENGANTESSALKAAAKRNSKTTWIFFATPAITTTYFTGKNLESHNLINSSASPLIVNPNQIGNTMRYNARIGLNLGAEMNYQFAEGWEIVAGTQLSYLGYNILAHKVHPTFSYLYLRNEDNSMEPKKYITYYGSGEGLDEVVLHNNSIQLSVPIGIKHSVWKNNNVEIKIGTSLQPSLVLNGHAYILSADGRNYVNDPELMRNVNISGEINSSISFQGEKVKWHIGPTVRYQALSSFKNIYPVGEHLIDYGIRIGISK